MTSTFLVDVLGIFSFGYFFRCIEKNFLQPFTFREKNRYNNSRVKIISTGRKGGEVFKMAY